MRSEKRWRSRPFQSRRGWRGTAVMVVSRARVRMGWVATLTAPCRLRKGFVRDVAEYSSQLTCCEGGISFGTLRHVQQGGEGRAGGGCGAGSHLGRGIMTGACAGGWRTSRRCVAGAQAGWPEGGGGWGQGERRHDMRDKRDDEVVDIGAWPELAHLAEEVRASGRPRALRRDGETLAVIVPLPRRARPLAKRRLSPRALDAFRAAAGSWSDVDVNVFLTDVYAARDVPDDRPPVVL